MARNEQDLRDRWERAYRNSGEYQTALKRDAIARVQQNREGQDAMRAALNHGDARRASMIQSQMMHENSQPGEHQAGLDAFQTDRENNYISDAEQQAGKTFRDVTSRPLGAITNGAGYLDALQNPDFKNYDPTASLKNVKMLFGGRDEGGFGDPNTDTVAAKAEAAAKAAEAGKKDAPPDYMSLSADPTGVTRQIALNNRNAQVDAQRHEQHFTASLPTELRPAYASLTGNMTPEEKTDFLSQSPEMRYGRLRSQLAAKQPQTPGTGGEIQDRFGVTHDYLPTGQEKPGSVGSSDFPAITKPVTLTRPTAALAKPAGAPYKITGGDLLGPGLQMAAAAPSFW